MSFRERERQRGKKRGDLSMGIVLAGLGLLFLTGWWWPGIALVVAAALAAHGLTTTDAVLRRRNLMGAVLLVLLPFFLQLGMWSWRLVAGSWPLLLIGAGAVVLWRALHADRVPDWRRWVDEAAADGGSGSRREAPVEATAFDVLSTISARGSEPPLVPTPESHPAPAKRGDVDLGVIFVEGERRIDRARRGDA
ncbi:MAG TPA: hypothetical protein VER55_06615 [Ardenticatenaceae bacterium]|nr:hypothetical protein [Ardenticatenaceae bacterium]